MDDLKIKNLGQITHYLEIQRQENKDRTFELSQWSEVSEMLNYFGMKEIEETMTHIETREHPGRIHSEAHKKQVGLQSHHRSCHLDFLSILQGSAWLILSLMKKAELMATFLSVIYFS